MASKDKPAPFAEPLSYQYGFGNEFQTEALPHALPVGQNNPKKCPYGLYAEQLSGSAFVAPRRLNKRTWQYRIRPSVCHQRFQPASKCGDYVTADPSACQVTPNQLRWKPTPIPESKKAVDFVTGLFTVCCSGSSAARSGYAIHLYAFTAPMHNTCMLNADGEMLLVPQQGTLMVTTEMGRLTAAPGEICVLPRGVRFSIDRAPSSGDTATGARGYVLESFGAPFQLPDLGPIGANGLASARDFAYPVAWFEDRRAGFKTLHKLEGEFFASMQDHSPFNVVAWHGNYAPYKYALKRFCPVNTVAFDHADPSVFTVLTSPGPAGTPAADFVVFPPRWNVAEHTFRPPYFHRNLMSEFMGLICGDYEAKRDGFLPGGSSLHVCMTAHGPDADTFNEATAAGGTEQPERVSEGALAFMFEVHALPRVTKHALQADFRDVWYQECWAGLQSNFTSEAGGGK